MHQSPSELDLLDDDEFFLSMESFSSILSSLWGAEGGSFLLLAFGMLVVVFSISVVLSSLENSLLSSWLTVSDFSFFFFTSSATYLKRARHSSF